MWYYDFGSNSKPRESYVFMYLGIHLTKVQSYLGSRFGPVTNTSSQAYCRYWNDLSIW